MPFFAQNIKIGSEIIKDSIDTSSVVPNIESGIYNSPSTTAVNRQKGIAGIASLNE